MKFSEIKEHISNSVVAETFLDIKRFHQKHKFLMYPLIIAIVVISVIIAPIITKYLTAPSAITEDENPVQNTFVQNVTVYISGEVNNPGVYTMTNEDRVEDVIEAAGGLKEGAFIEYINLAQRLYDEQYINIPSANENVSKKSTTTKVFDGVVNINKATASEFTQLPGIGEVTANRIVEYRNNVGDFEDIRDIMNVEGIGQSLFDKIRYNLTL